MKRAFILYNLLLMAGCFLALPAAMAAVPDGDINANGEVDVVDVLWAVQTVLGNRSLDSTQMMHGDVAPLVSGVPNPDGNIDAGDIVVILRVAMGFLDLSFPVNQFNIGDSIGEGEAADGTIGEAHHETVWSTGYDGSDVVNSFNERLDFIESAGYYENNDSRDAIFNHAVSGAVMADFAGQAQAVISATVQTPSADAGMVTVLLGNNDVCAPSIAEMTDPALFETQYRAGLDVLAANDATRDARIHVSGIPAIYWLWDAKRGRSWCTIFAWPLVPCENLLDNPDDDCASDVSRNDPDNDYPGDGANCLRRKTFHRTIRETYNPILKNVLAEYRGTGQLPNAGYTDIYDVKFGESHVNGGNFLVGDCFHPSTAGHALLADKEWCRTQWGTGDPICSN